MNECDYSPIKLYKTGGEIWTCGCNLPTSAPKVPPWQEFLSVLIYDSKYLMNEHSPFKIGTILIFILQIMKLKHRS